MNTARARKTHAAALALALALGTGCRSGEDAGTRSSPAQPDRPDLAGQPQQPARPGAEPVPPAPIPGTPDPRVTPDATAPPAPSRRARLEYEQTTIAVFRRVAPTTVFVTQNQVVRDRWSMRALEVPSGTGTGFVWDGDGHIVTNFHVVAGGRSWTVTMYDGETITAELVGGDPNKDIAVLKIAGKAPLVPIVLPPQDSVREVGQAALAIGNPFGLDHTLTTGVVSALGREVKGYGGVTIRDMIQTDASINPGNSGGPLLNTSGELIGMNTMIYSQSGASAGIGFAVPVETLRRIVPQLIQFGKPRRAGLLVDLVSDAIARRNGIRGVVIQSVLRGGPADRAGLRGLRRTRQGPAIGDVIVGVGEHEVSDYDTLYNALDRYQPGDEVTVKVLRNGETVEVRVTLEALP